MVRRLTFLLLLASLLLLGSVAASAQTFPQPSYFQKFFVKPERNIQLPPMAGVDQFVHDGKLRLSLADAIQLTLENSTDIQLNRLQLDTARYSLRRTYGVFDPVLTASFAPSRSTSPTTSTLQGASTLSNLSHSFQSNYSQLFQSGTQYQVTFNASRSASNSVFSTFNPSLFSSLTVSLGQNLLRNRGFFANRAPIVIAQRNLKLSRANFEAQVNDAIARAVNQYWDVVQARESLKVTRDALDMAEATYKQNKRALELGALPPLDIYRSESQVAQRKLQLIQAEYSLKQVEDELRRTIGASLDQGAAALDLDLTEPASATDMASVDVIAAIQQAMQSRPELEALHQQTANDDTNIKLAHNNLQPDLSLSSFYSMNGRGGNELDTSGASPVIISRGGLTDAFDQLGSMNYPGYGLTLNLRLPLRNRAAEADLGNALVSKRKSLYLTRQRQELITLEVKHAVDQLEQAKLSVAAAKLNRDLSQKNLEAEQRKYELGAQTIFFVLDAQTQLSAAEQSLVQAQISYQRAVVSVDRATGQLLAKNHVEIQ